MGNKWRGFMVATVAAAWLAVPGAVQPASAALISGQFSMTGTDIWSNAGNTLGVSSGLVNTGTGDFAPLVGTTITFNQCTLATPCSTQIQITQVAQHC